MLNYYYTEKLFGVKGARVTKIDSNNKKIHLHFKLECKTHNCLNCHQQTDTIHDYRIQVFKYAPVLGLDTFFHYRKNSTTLAGNISSVAAICFLSEVNI